MALVGRMLRGRDAELELLRGLLARARDGESGVLVLRGEPGIGKTALLAAAVKLAGELLVLRARGVQSESEIAFAGLQELFAQVLGRLDCLPERQRAVLASALALGPPVPGDPLAVRAATLSMLAAAAEDAPVLAVIDDAHWLDPPSAEALAFACRRLQSEGVLALFAMREAEPSAFDPAGLRVLEVAGLTEESARAVLAESAGPGIAPAVVERLVEVAGGNPLALEELPGTLSADQLAGREMLQEPLPVGGAVNRAFARQLTLLPPESREAVLIAAASDQDEPGTIAAAIRARGLTMTAFGPAERAGLVAIAEGEVQFRHPLLRSVIYQTASGEQRRGAHGALAVALDEASDRRAWHLAAAAAGPDERVAAALEDAAGRAAARAGLSTAARSLERAARLSEDTQSRCRRLLGAARHAYASGRPDWAATLADEGLPLATSAVTRADYRHLAAAAERNCGSALRARQLLSAAADEIAGEDPARATSMLIDATLTDIMSGDLRAAAASGDRARALAASCPSDMPLLASAAADLTAVYLGALPADGVDVDALLSAIGPTIDLSPAAFALEVLWVNSYAQFRDSAQTFGSAELDRRIATARRDGALGLLPLLLGFAANLDFREDRWLRGAAAASEAVELAGETGQGNHRTWGLVNLTRFEAAQGLEAACRDHVAEGLELADALDLGSLEVHLLSVLGLLELGLGNISDAVQTLEECARLAQACGLAHPPTVPYEPDLVEALCAVGRARDARFAADTLEERAQLARSPWGLATAARCRGLVSNKESFEGEFEAALELHEQAPGGFDRARTELCYAERLRRSRRRAEAREHLASALAVFERLRAEPWAERSRRELQATGITARARRDPSAADRLTPQELRVAFMIAGGATNREAATQLFLSPKTIEAHLARVYRKLGVHNRAQLTAAVTRQDATSL